MITDNDVQRLAKALKAKPSEVTSKYLQLDIDNDYEFKTSPCPFIDKNDNMCSVYEFRPRACREYPHTNRQKEQNILFYDRRNK